MKKIIAGSAIMSLLVLTTGTSLASTTYTVQSGDTLWGISTQYHISVDQLEQANSLTSSLILIGEQLSIPSSDSSTPSPPSNLSDSSHSSSRSDTTYVVQSGDTLWGIAHTYGETVNGLMSDNNLDSYLIQIGQRLTVRGHGDSSTASSRSESFDSIVAAKSTNSAGNQVVRLAKKLLGVDYVWGGESTSGFDCSGFVKYVMAEAGHYLPRSTYEQVYSGTYVSRSNLEAGDLVFFDTGDGVSHVGIYIGNGQFIHSDSSSGVTITSLNDPYYWSSRYVTGRHII